MAEVHAGLIVAAPPSVGSMVVVEIGDRAVTLTRLASGELVGFDDSCTHRQCPLSDGVIDDSSVTCPCHKSRFDLRTGRPSNGPATDPIRIYRVVEAAEGLLVEPRKTQEE